MDRQITCGWERVQRLPGCELGVSLIVDRVASDLIVESSEQFYMVETFTRSTIEGDCDLVSNKVPADRVAEMFRDIRPCGGGVRFERV